MSDLSREEARQIAHDAATDTISEVFKILGVDTSDVESMNTFRADIDWVRHRRKAEAAVGQRIVMTLISIASGGFAVAAWEYLKSTWSGH